MSAGLSHPGSSYQFRQQLEYQPSSSSRSGYASPPLYLPGPSGIVRSQSQLLPIALTSYEIPTTYMVFNRLGQPLYVVEEHVDSCGLMCICCRRQPFEMVVRDIATQKEVILISRRTACCQQEVCVSCPSAANVLLGTVVKRVTFITPIFEVSNPQRTPLFKIEGPAIFSMMGIGYDIDFKITSLDGSNAIIGNISRQTPGLLQTMFKDEENFGISFPVDLDVRMKALLLGATIFVDYTLYEE